MVRPEVKKKQRKLAEVAAQSRKAQKKLKKVVLRKKLKDERKNLLGKLKKFQLPAEQINRLHSTSSMQTAGLKRFASEINEPVRQNKAQLAEQCLDASLLIRRKRRKLERSKQPKADTSSEDTDDISTDTEVYDDNQDELDKEEIIREEAEKEDTFDKVEPKQELAKEEPVKHIVHKEKKAPEPAVYVPVIRLPEIESKRLELPIIGEEQRIMEKIRYHDVVIVSGETGSGKTTQLPQFLYEAGYALNEKIIGVTEPRRVAAVAMSERVAQELNLTSDEVAYQIRFAGTVSESTRIKFMTDGVLLRECQQDFLLKKYSVIIIDEAHERSVFSDILIGLLSRIVPLRSKKGDPLKLVIMSATLRVGDFTENSFLFPKVPPVIKVEARQYPVSIQFAKKTPTDYLLAAYKKVCSIHKKMPRGGILVFVTSQMDVKKLCANLRKKSMLFCLGLYAMLPIEKQQLVFKKPPEGSRLCVIATNVAETSITIPNIKYVVDTGKEKRKVYDLFTGVSEFVTTWTSKSSAEQRAGRAGRMGPGHCFRLYSSAVYTNDLIDHAEPQILQKPVEDVLLQMKTMNIDNVVNFPFPTRPSIEALKAAEKRLTLLGALDDSKFKNARFDELSKTEFASKPTALGKAMARYALSARCSKMMVLAPANLLPYVICLVSALTVREMFINGNQWRELRRKWVGHGNLRQLGDFALMIRAVCIADSFKCADKHCRENGLNHKAMLEIDKLRRMLIHEASNNQISQPIDSEKKLKKPSESQCKILRQLLLSSFCDHVARKLPDGEIVDKNPNELDKSQKKKLKNAYECMECDEPVYIETESILKTQHPEYIIYKELYKGERKMYMRDVAVVEPDWFPFYADKLCNFSDPTAASSLSSNQPRYDKASDQIVCTRSTTYGSLNWQLGFTEVPMRMVEKGKEIYEWFAYFLLSGDVIDWFKIHRSKLITEPKLIFKSWFHSNPRIKFLQALISADVKTKADLVKIWQSDPSCKFSENNQRYEYFIHLELTHRPHPLSFPDLDLKREYLNWIPEASHAQIKTDWAQLHLSH